MLAVTKTNLRSCMKTSPFTFCLWLYIHTPTYLQFCGYVFNIKQVQL